MWWSKSKTTLSAEETELECRDEVKEQDIAQENDASEAQYPAFKIVLATVLSVCLAVFLTALVSLLGRVLGNWNKAP